MKMYIAKYSNSLYHYGDSITEEEYDEMSITQKDQFILWYDTEDIWDDETCDYWDRIDDEWYHSEN